MFARCSLSRSEWIVRVRSNRHTVRSGHRTHSSDVRFVVSPVPDRVRFAVCILPSHVTGLSFHTVIPHCALCTAPRTEPKRSIPHTFRYSHPHTNVCIHALSALQSLCAHCAHTAPHPLFSAARTVCVRSSRDSVNGWFHSAAPPLIVTALKSTSNECVPILNSTPSYVPRPLPPHTPRIPPGTSVW